MLALWFCATRSVNVALRTENGLSDATEERGVSNTEDRHSARTDITRAFEAIVTWYLRRNDIHPVVRIMISIHPFSIAQCARP